MHVESKSDDVDETCLLGFLNYLNTLPARFCVIGVWFLVALLRVMVKLSMILFGTFISSSMTDSRSFELIEKRFPQLRLTRTHCCL